MSQSYAADRPAYAPRCFGFASAYGADDAICRQCQAAAECGPIAKQNLLELSALVDIGNIGTMHFIADKPAAETQVTLLGSALAAATKKTKNPKLDALIERINKCAPNAAALLAAGENPFSVSDKPAFLRAIAAELLKDPINDGIVIGILQERFGLPAQDADNQCKLIKSALINIGAVTEEDHHLIIRKSHEGSIIN